MPSTSLQSGQPQSLQHPQQTNFFGSVIQRDVRVKNRSRLITYFTEFKKKSTLRSQRWNQPSFPNHYSIGDTNRLSWDAAWRLKADTSNCWSNYRSRENFLIELMPGTR
jgi:hypothetical protein